MKPIWILAQFTNCSTFRPSFTSRIICYTIFRTGAFLRTVTSFTNAVLLLRFASLPWKHHLPTPLHRSAAATVPEPSAAAAVLALLCWACCHRIPSRRLLRNVRGLYLVAAAQPGQHSRRRSESAKPVFTRFFFIRDAKPGTQTALLLVEALLLYCCCCTNSMEFRNSGIRTFSASRLLLLKKKESPFFSAIVGACSLLRYFAMLAAAS